MTHLKELSKKELRKLIDSLKAELDEKTEQVDTVFESIEILVKDKQKLKKELRNAKEFFENCRNSFALISVENTQLKKEAFDLHHNTEDESPNIRK